ncbi:MAG: TlpA family protein disulfide reductase [Nitrospiria bacterium]
MRKVVYIILFILSGLVLFGEIRADETRPKAPPFELVSLDGKKMTQEDLIGKATLMVFWASWCGTCQSELPKIHLLQEKMKGRPFQVIAIGFKDSRTNILRYVDSHQEVFSFPVFYDTRNRVAARFGARVTPTLFLFDKNGALAVPYRGGGLLDHPKFQKVLESLL